MADAIVSQFAIISLEDAKSKGLKRYFTGDACPNGHIAERYVKARGCVVCMADRVAAARASKPKGRIGRPPIPVELQKARRKAQRSANVERYRQYQNKYYANNKAKIAEKKLEWWKANPEAVSAIMRRWRLAHPETVRAHDHARRSREAKAEGSYTGDELKRLYELQKGCCAGCRARLNKKYHADHIVPIARGGSNYITNIQLLCKTCNLRKHARDPIEWAQRNGRLL